MACTTNVNGTSTVLSEICPTHSFGFYLIIDSDRHLRFIGDVLKMEDLTTEQFHRIDEIQNENVSHQKNYCYYLFKMQAILSLSNVNLNILLSSHDIGFELI